VQPFALASQFVFTADVKQGIDPATVEKAIAEEWANFLKHGPTDEELERSRMSSRAGFIRGLEKVGGFSGKATVLAESQVYRGDPCLHARSGTHPESYRQREGRGESLDREGRLHADRAACC
jgi:hypothetical protein